jgi:hypothetical protein
MSHTFLGEQEARPLVEWLNRANREKSAPVVALYRNLVRLMLGPEPTDLKEVNTEPYIGVASGESTYGRLMKKVQWEMRTLHRWPVVSLVNMADGNFRFEWIAEDEVTKMKLALVDLAMLGKGTFVNLRICKFRGCGKWFFRRYKHQGFCCTAHQQSDYRQSPEWKEHRRNWAKDNRKKKAALERGKP